MDFQGIDIFTWQEVEADNRSLPYVCDQSASLAELGEGSLLYTPLAIAWRRGTRQKLPTLAMEVLQPGLLIQGSQGMPYGCLGSTPGTNSRSDPG